MMMFMQYLNEVRHENQRQEHQLRSPALKDAEFILEFGILGEKKQIHKPGRKRLSKVAGMIAGFKNKKQGGQEYYFMIETLVA